MNQDEMNSIFILKMNANLTKLKLKNIKCTQTKITGNKTHIQIQLCGTYTTKNVSAWI